MLFWVGCKVRAVEQAVQKIEDEARTIRDRIPPTHNVLAWLIEHVASIDRRTSVGEDGKTPIERTRGRRGRDWMAELGESLLYIPLRRDSDDKRVAKINLEPSFLFPQ